MTAAQKKKKLKAMKAKLATLTPNTPDWDAQRYAIVNLQDDPVSDAATPGSTNLPTPSAGEKDKTTSPAKATSVSFSYDEMVAKTGFSPTERNVKAMEKRSKSVPTPTFISGGTPAQKAALAKKIANMTITSGMSAADAAKIRKARLWYTGQTGGRTGKGKAGDAKFTSGSVKDQLVRGKKAGTPQKRHKKTSAGDAHVVLTGQNRGGTTADVKKQEAARAAAKSNPQTKTKKPQKAFVRSPVNVEKPQKRYGGALGANPESSTAGRGAATVPPAKKDRFRGRKSRSQTKTTALPGAGGSLEFATAAVAREKRVAARKKAEAANRASESLRERIATAKEAGTRLGKGRREKRPVVNPIPESVGSYLSNFITSGQSPLSTGKGGGGAGVSNKQRAVARKKAKTEAELRSVGYNPKPKKPKKSGFGGGR